MTAYILYRFTPDNVTIMGAYTSQAAADAAKITKINAYLVAKNAARDAAYQAGEACDAVLTFADVEPLVHIDPIAIG